MGYRGYGPHGQWGTGTMQYMGNVEMGNEYSGIGYRGMGYIGNGTHR